MVASTDVHGDLDSTGVHGDLDGAFTELPGDLREASMEASTKSKWRPTRGLYRALCRLLFDLHGV